MGPSETLKKKRPSVAPRLRERGLKVPEPQLLGTMWQGSCPEAPGAQLSTWGPGPPVNATLPGPASQARARFTEQRPRDRGHPALSHESGPVPLGLTCWFPPIRQWTCGLSHPQGLLEGLGGLSSLPRNVSTGDPCLLGKSPLPLSLRLQAAQLQAEAALTPEVGTRDGHAAQAESPPHLPWCL